MRDALGLLTVLVVFAGIIVFVFIAWISDVDNRLKRLEKRNQ